MFQVILHVLYNLPNDDVLGSVVCSGWAGGECRDVVMWGERGGGYLWDHLAVTLTWLMMEQVGFCRLTLHPGPLQACCSSS